MLSLHVWLCVTLVCLSSGHCKPPELKVVACINSTSATAELSFRCAHYYKTSEEGTWTDAYRHCRTQGLELAAPHDLRRERTDEQQMQDADSDVRAEIFNVTWIRSHLVYQRSQDNYLKSFETTHVKHQWFVNAHLIWYNASGAALRSGTLLSDLTNDGYVYKNHSVNHQSARCGSLLQTFEGQELSLISCTDAFLEHSLNYSYFACLSPKNVQRLECPRNWTTATVASTGGRVEVGKCFKQLIQSYTPNDLTWDGTRALCLREGGDLLSVGTDLEGVWLHSYSREFVHKFHTGLSLFMNLHEKLYCPASGKASCCWSSRVLQGALEFPNWKCKPNNGLVRRAKDCVELFATEEQISLNDVYCNRNSNYRNHQVAVVCELTLHSTQSQYTVPTPFDLTQSQSTVPMPSDAAVGTQQALAGPSSSPCPQLQDMRPFIALAVTFALLNAACLLVLLFVAYYCYCRHRARNGVRLRFRDEAGDIATRPVGARASALQSSSRTPVRRSAMNPVATSFILRDMPHRSHSWSNAVVHMFPVRPASWTDGAANSDDAENQNDEPESSAAGSQRQQQSVRVLHRDVFG